MTAPERTIVDVLETGTQPEQVEMAVRQAIERGLTTAKRLPSDELTAPDLLAFADIEAPRIRAVPLEQHIAEKLHAYTRRYGPAAASSRPKDLIDLILISEITDFNFSRLREVIVSVFEARASHNLPLLLPDPPGDWARPYRKLANEVGLDPDPLAGYQHAVAFLQPILLNELGFEIWDSEKREWREAT